MLNKMFILWDMLDVGKGKRLFMNGWDYSNITKYLLVEVRTTWNKDTEGVGESS